MKFMSEQTNGWMIQSVLLVTFAPCLVDGVADTFVCARVRACARDMNDECMCVTLVEIGWTWSDVKERRPSLGGDHIVVVMIFCICRNVFLYHYLERVWVYYIHLF